MRLWTVVSTTESDSEERFGCLLRALSVMALFHQFL